MNIEQVFHFTFRIGKVKIVLKSMNEHSNILLTENLLRVIWQSQKTGDFHAKISEIPHKDPQYVVVMKEEDEK